MEELRAEKNQKRMLMDFAEITDTEREKRRQRIFLKQQSRNIGARRRHR